MGVLANRICTSDCSMFLSHQNCKKEPEKCGKIIQTYYEIMAMSCDMQPEMREILNKELFIINCDIEPIILGVVDSAHKIQELIKQRLEGEECGDALNLRKTKVAATPKPTDGQLRKYS